MALTVTSITPDFGPTAGNTPIVVAGSDFESVNRCALLLHFNGTDGSTTITDDSGNSATLTANGNAHIETDDKKFGTASAYFDGSGDYIQLDNPYSTFGDFVSDFTIECWVKWKTLPAVGTGGERQIIGQNQWLESQASGNWWGLFGASYGLAFVARSVGFYQGLFGNYTWVVDTWYHVAAVRKGPVLRLFVNGGQIAIDNSYTRTLFADDSRPLTIGADTGGDAQQCHAYIDDLRVLKDFAAYEGALFDLPEDELKRHAARIKIDGNPCTNVVVVSDTEITANTPSGTVGSKDVILSI